MTGELSRSTYVVTYVCFFTTPVKARYQNIVLEYWLGWINNAESFGIRSCIEKASCKLYFAILFGFFFLLLRELSALLVSILRLRLKYLFFLVQSVA